MVSLADVFRVFISIIPLYFASALGYTAVSCKVFTDDQCTGMNKFVALVAIPLLAFRLIATNNPYTINLRFLAADSLEKVITLILLVVWAKFRRKPDSKSWVISLFSITNFPNTIVIGTPLLGGMYRDGNTGSLISQIVLFNTVWFNFVAILMYEYIVASAFLNFTPDAATTRAPTARVLRAVFLKMVKNPNIYAAVLGVSWSLVSFRWHVDIPHFADSSISFISGTAIALAMFSLGMATAQQPKFISCKGSIAVLVMAVKFVLSPAIMAICSVVVGLSGDILRIAIVQAALPLAVLSFVYAKEYNVHPEIMSTGVILGMLLALPFTIFYYFFLALV